MKFRAGFTVDFPNDILEKGKAFHSEKMGVQLTDEQALDVLREIFVKEVLEEYSSPEDNCYPTDITFELLDS